MKQSTLRTAKTMQYVNGVSHAKLVENRVTLQAPEPVFKSAGLQAFKTSCTDVMNFVKGMYPAPHIHEHLATAY